MANNHGAHKFYIGQSTHGIGVFAARNIKNREIITVFKGPLITSYKQTQTPENKDHYFQIGINLYQGKMPERRRPVNHSCNPNSGIIGSATLLNCSSAMDDASFLAIAFRSLDSESELILNFIF